jgi:hypothetical protein
LIRRKLTVIDGCQTGPPLPEPYRILPSIFEPNHLPNVLYGTIRPLCMAPRTVHPRTVPYRTEHFRAKSPPRSEFSSASRTESRGESVRCDSVRITNSGSYHTSSSQRSSAAPTNPYPLGYSAISSQKSRSKALIQGRLTVINGDYHTDSSQNSVMGNYQAPYSQMYSATSQQRSSCKNFLNDQLNSDRRWS